MNPHASHSIRLSAMLVSILQHWPLIRQMVVREVVGRYKGTIIGIGWSAFTPIFMLTVYTFVFSTVFKARWGVGDDNNNVNFAVVLFVGLIVHGLFAEVINRAPSLIASNVSYVKKVIFPLEILPIIAVGGALFQSFTSVLVLLCGILFLNGHIHLTALLLPVVIFPFLLMTLGISWVVASLGVYLRDLSHIIGMVTTVMLFLAPVFYPISALPETFRFVIMLNPLTFIIEQLREVLLLGNLPDWGGLAVYTLVSTLVAWFGYAWFQKTRRGFSDVL